MKMGIITAAVILAVSWASPARAFLGSNENSLNVAKLLFAPRSEKITNRPSHTVHEYAVIRGVIRAYVSSNGDVFAYTGRDQMGHPPPELLGPYLKEYQDAVREARRKYGRRPLSINTAHIKAGISGPQGSLHWYIYLQNLPAGVSADDIQ
ncbi:MAG: DUF2844 domain-containing protein [Oligoflexia bacterium]|nr:DUF2844 domain-containing protein [Oligoflexia bacterium]